MLTRRSVFGALCALVLVPKAMAGKGGPCRYRGGVLYETKEWNITVHLHECPDWISFADFENRSDGLGDKAWDVVYRRICRCDFVPVRCFDIPVENRGAIGVIPFHIEKAPR